MGNPRRRSIWGQQLSTPTSIPHDPNALLLVNKEAHKIHQENHVRIFHDRTFIGFYFNFDLDSLVLNFRVLERVRDLIEKFPDDMAKVKCK